MRWWSIKQQLDLLSLSSDYAKGYGYLADHLKVANELKAHLPPGAFFTPWGLNQLQLPLWTVWRSLGMWELCSQNLRPSSNSPLFPLVLVSPLPGVIVGHRVFWNLFSFAKFPFTHRCHFLPAATLELINSNSLYHPLAQLHMFSFFARFHDRTSTFQELSE